MARTAVRRVNEWDGPSMLKVYTPYTGTPAAPEREAPDLQAYVRRIDRYTYGLGWLLCEIDHQTVGFCHLSEDPAAPGKYLLDLEQALLLQARRAGLREERIYRVGLCTHCAPNLFSHRRDRGRTGRMWGLVMLPPR